MNVQLKVYKRRANLIFFLAPFILSILITAIFYFVYYSCRVGFVYVDEALFKNFYMVLFLAAEIGGFFVFILGSVYFSL